MSTSDLRAPTGRDTSSHPDNDSGRAANGSTTSSVARPRPAASVGSTTEPFQPVRDQFEAYLLEDPSYSAQVAIYWNGQPAVDLAGGPHLRSDSVTGIFSATKGVAALTLATLLEDRQLDLDQRVSHYWPEFGCLGKEQVLVRQLLSHQVGLVNVPGGLNEQDYSDSTALADRLARARPAWQPGAEFGYHGLTIGAFMEELVRRVTGSTLQALYEERVRAPRDIDCWLGLPPEQDHRYQPLLPIEHTVRSFAEAELSAFTGDSVSAYAYNRFTPNPVPMPDFLGDQPAALMTNDPAIRAGGFASAAGVASAKGLAQVYAAALGHLGPALFSEEVRDAISQEQVFGHDRIANVQRAFAVVFLKPAPVMDFGSWRAFGHDGANGRLAYADPTYGLAFGYIPSPMQHVRPGIGADDRSLRLSRLARECVARAAVAS
jgi:CubicO group peptidase (beta-lactamase class C family)